MKISKLVLSEVRSALSPSEKTLLNAIGEEEISVRNLHARVRKNRMALTSVAVSLDRLYKKGIVNRRIEHGRGGLRYIYRLRQDKEKFERSLVVTTVDKLLEKFGPVALSYFQERFGKKAKKK